MRRGFPNGEVTMLIGQTLESRIDFPWVSKGTRGTVTKAVPLGNGALRLVIDWNLHDRGHHRILRDSFTISNREFQRFFWLVAAPTPPKAD